jgi:HlyD family secretion protein
VVDVENDEHLLEPGMTASVSFVCAERNDARLVSNAALRLRPDPSTIAVWHASAPAAVSGEQVLWMLRRAGVEPVRVRVGIGDGSVSALLEGDVELGERAIIEVNESSKRSH